MGRFQNFLIYIYRLDLPTISSFNKWDILKYKKRVSVRKVLSNQITRVPKRLREAKAWEGL